MHDDAAEPAEQAPDPLADLVLIAAPSWAADAACVEYGDLELWTADAAPHSEEVAVAAHICRRCPVRVQCAEYASTHPVYGLWAGVWHSELRGILRRRRSAA